MVYGDTCFGTFETASTMQESRATFDEILESVGAFGPYQFYIIFLTGVGFMAVGVHAIGAVFTAGLPTYHCVDDRFGHNRSTSNYSARDFNETVCSAPTDQCYTSSGQECSHWEYDKQFYTSTITTEVKYRHYHFSYSLALSNRLLSSTQTTDRPVRYAPCIFLNAHNFIALSERFQWNLVCGREWQIALSQSLFMVGFLVGGMLFGNLADT